MKIAVTILFCLASVFCTAQNKLGAIGQWRGHFDNHSVRNVVKGDAIYASTPYQIAKLDASGLVLNWLDKTNGLNDIDIANMAWNNSSQELIIVYANSNIDIVKGDRVYNINAIQLTSIYADKKINAIYNQQNLTLLATNFGIVSIDLKKHEIKETWQPGTSQQPVITYALTIAHDSIFAATENGVWVSPFINNVPTPNSWVRLINLDNLNIHQLIQKNNLIYGFNATSIYQLPNPIPIAQVTNAQIQQIDTTVNNCILNIHYGNQKGAILQLNKNNTFTTVLDSSILNRPMHSLLDNTTLWIADSTLGLGYQSNTFKWINLGGTKASIQGIISVNTDNILAPFGNYPGYAILNTAGWNNVINIGNNNLPNLTASTILNTDNSFWFTYSNGLLHVNNDNHQFENIKPNNNTGSFQDIHIDQNNAIWAIQNQQGIVRKLNNSWNSIPIPNTLNNNGFSSFIVSNQQQAWIIAPYQQGLYVYQSRDIFSNEIWKQLSTDPSNGNLPSNHVTSITNDKLGSIWVGTDNGIGIYNCGDISNTACNAYLPIVSNNGFNGYLFQKEIIHSITVDGANRKWIGTNNGAWLLSEDGLTIIEHFNKLNSPLTNDTVVQIIIEPGSGEVFFNTANQMVSYRGTATQGAATQDHIKIFPNPIPPNFNGYIAIKGLVDNAIVKITDINGKLLFQTTALGGQAVWNMHANDGNKVATGIYLVFVRDLNGNETGVGKMVIADGY